MSRSNKNFSASYVSDRFGIIEKTTRLFILKIREVMESSEDSPMTDIVHLEEFFLRAPEKGKVDRSYKSQKKRVIIIIKVTDDGEGKKMYERRIDDF